MNVTTPRPNKLGALVAMLAALAAVIIAVAAWPGDAPAARAHACDDVVVQFEPEGSGGATEIRAKRIGCDNARKVIRACIKGELKPGWAGEYVDPKFKLKKNDKRVKYLPVGGGGCIPVSRAAGPQPPAGADRVETFKPNLDEDDARERVLVYNLPEDGVPASYFDVWKKKGGEWKRKQRELVSQSPGSPESGLVEAWVSDLNQDERVEIAVRDFITPSVGQTLTIYRQKSETAKEFKRLQGIGGDSVGVSPKKAGKAKVKVYISAGHSPDGVEHHEVWKWSGEAGQWTCRTDCAPRPE